MQNSNFNKVVLENFIADHIGATLNENKSQSGIDAYLNGQTVEIKGFNKNRPSLTENEIDFTKSLETLIDERLKSDLYVIYLGKKEELNADKIQVLNKEEFKEWVIKRVAIDRKSKNRDKFKFRIGRNERTVRANQKMEEFGLM